MTYTKHLALTTIGLAFAGVAAAGFRVDTPEYRPAVHPGAHKSHIGVPENYVLASNKRLDYVELTGTVATAPVAGFGNTIPIGAGLEMILPENWLAYLNPTLDATTPISWSSDQSWLDALRGIAVRNQLRFFVDFNNAVVRVEPMPTKSALVRISKYAPPEIPVSAAPPVAGGHHRPDDGSYEVVATDASGNPVTYYYPHESSEVRQDASAGSTQPMVGQPPNGPRNKIANTPIGTATALGAETTPLDVEAISAAPSAGAPVEPGPAQVDAMRAWLAEQGLTAEARQTLPWFYREMADGTTIRQIAGGRHPDASMTLTEFYADLLVLNIVNAPVAEVIQRIAPPGWEVAMETPPDFFEDRVVARLTAERARGQVISQLQRQLDIAITPYPIQNLIVVTAN